MPVPSRRARDPRRLGARAGRVPATRLAGRDAGVRRALGALSAHEPVGPRPRRRAARRARWATRRSATSTSAPAPSSSRTWPGSTTPSPTAAVRERGAARRLHGGPRERRGRLHLMGLVSDGGVHSVGPRRGADRARRAGGRSGRRRPRVHRRARHAADLGAVLRLRARALAARTRGRVGTVSGRYYAMDRDRRWERTKLAYDAIVHGAGPARRRRRGSGRRRRRAGRDRRVHPPDRDRRLRRGPADGT